MLLATIDWVFIVAFFVISLGIGVAVARKAGQSAEAFFLSGRNMPWWLLGISMVATTFAADTPQLVTDIVRQNGIAGNWVWWAFLLTGLLTVFVYAKLWRRSGVLTDLAFYEIRYSGEPAAFLRGFRALYLGVFFNVYILAVVSLALIKIGEVMLGWDAVTTLLVASLVTVVYSSLGGLRGVLITDFFQFLIAMFGAIAAAVIALNLPEVGGLSGLLAHPNVVPKLDFLPDFSDTEAVLTLLVLPLAVQWWSVWYPGAEPGGGGYVAQRMLAARSERGAMGATLLFNAAHYALRPWPWILVALASLVVFPDLNALAEAFPNVPEDRLKHDLAYPAMLTYLPHGLLGVVVASLLAAFMSTISTQLNWGSSYLVHDCYQRFVNPDATPKQQVAVGRLATVGLMVLGAGFALLLENALGAFNLVLQIGAGTGLLFILRWFWWRINAFSEITAMVVSFLVALYFQFGHEALGFVLPSPAWQLVLGVGITTLAWVVVTLLTPPDDPATLRRFYELTQPGGPGWRKVVTDARADGVTLASTDAAWDVPLGILCLVLGCFAIYGTLFATGYWIFGETGMALLMTTVAVGSTLALTHLWKRLRIK